MGKEVFITDLQLLCLDFSKSIHSQAEVLGISHHTLRKKLRAKGLLTRFKFTKRTYSSKEAYEQNPKQCVHCLKPLLYTQRRNEYCSGRCAALHTQQIIGHRKVSVEERQRLSIWGKLYAYRNAKQRTIKTCPACANQFSVIPSRLIQICCNRKCYNLWMKKTGYMRGKTGGYRKEAGKGKMGWYKGYFCNSSWELAWVIYNLDHGVVFTRNLQSFPYTFDGRQYKYYPDFKLEGDQYVEIKGWITNKDLAKFSQFPHQLTIVGKPEIKSILQYVHTTYGKSFVNLYQYNPINI